VKVFQESSEEAIIDQQAGSEVAKDTEKKMRKKVRQKEVSLYNLWEKNVCVARSSPPPPTTCC
jgi:hypothetical protein